VIGSSTAASTDSTKYISPRALARSEKQRTDPIIEASVDTEEEASNKHKYVSLILTAIVHDAVSS